MQLIFATTLAVLSLLPSAINASALHPRAAGYCDTQRIKKSGDYSFHVPAYGSSENTDCLMNSGATGSGVVALQNTINSCYAPSPYLSVDGDYGPKTKAAVKVVQNKVGTTQDGIYGPKTAAAMRWIGYDESGEVCRSLTF
jgi:murein L,D-transpeptidase YcbB/YkuD